MLAGAFILLNAPVVAWAATASIDPAVKSVGVGGSFTLTVSFDSAAAYNAGGATVSFDDSLLTLTGVSKGSVFGIWPTEPRTTNPVVFDAGNTSPISGKQAVVKLTFKAKKEGVAEVKFDKASIMSADTSSEIAEAKTGAAITISGTAAPVPSSAPALNSASKAEEETVSGGGDLPPAPFINSKTLAKETDYAGGNSVKFDWDLPSDVTVVAAEVDTSSTTIPKKKFEPAIADLDIHEMAEGENWIHVRFKNSAGWGKTTHRKFLYDKTAPESFTVTASTTPQSSTVELTFITTDTLSGIDHYEVSTDGGQVLKVQPDVLKLGSYPVSNLQSGPHSTNIIALDKAGNKSEASVSYKIDAPAKTDVCATTDGEDEGWPWGSIFATIFALGVGLLSGTLWKERKEFKQEKFIAKREADEARDRVAAVFAALREEARDRLGELSEKPNPSALDREVGKKMSDALDLSEEVINKEVEDVRKLLSH